MTSSPLSDSYYNDRFYPVRSSVNVPRDVSFKDGVTLTINYAKYAEVTSSLATFLRSASERGDNIGTDEFVGSTLDSLADYAFIFTAKSKAAETQSSIVAFIIIGPSEFARTVDPCLADIHVIRTCEVANSTYFELVELSTELTRELDVGYTDCILQVSTSCDKLIDVMSSQYQFTAAGTVPKSVHIANGIGLVGSTILVRNIVSPDFRRQPRPLDDVLAMLAKHDIADGPVDDKTYERATLPSIPFLPQQYVFKKANLPVKIRNMYKHEDRALYELVKISRERGEGIGVHNRPNLAYFRNFELLKGWCVVFEEAATCDTVGFLYLTNSPFTRSKQSKSFHELIVLTKPYQDRGLGTEIAAIGVAFAITLGYTSMVNCCLANNARSRHIMETPGGEWSDIGVTPRAAFVAEAGWQDLILRYDDLCSRMPVILLREELRKLRCSISVNSTIITSKL